MWKYHLICALYLLLSLHSAVTENSQEVTLKCVQDDNNFEQIVYFDCEFSDVSSVKSPLTVISSDLDVKKWQESNFFIHVDIKSNKNYPESLPEGIGTVINGIVAFKYRKSPLKYIQRSDFSGMASKLHLVSLEDNKIEEIPFDTFHDLFKLEYLDIRRNRVKNLPSNMFAMSLNFQTLIVDGNELTKLHPDLFKNNQNFRTLYAEFNKIDEFHENLFRNNPKMMVISMRHNKISHIPIDFTEFKDLDVADFTHNAGTCDTMYFIFKPYVEYYDENEQKKWIKTVPEFQKKIEETCRES